ncbi:unnamed protein product [Rotaria sordida]|uniref:Uncharacterized protein n=1 Tax=Rotaria sordida TaxID=392033 RepID=A0A814I591_9BILA|nr:unnamed protein product [Rotaria sordida]
MQRIVETSSIGNKAGSNESVNSSYNNNNNKKTYTSKSTNAPTSQSPGISKASTSANNNTSGKLFKSLFGIQQSKQLSRSNSATTPLASNNTPHHQSDTGVTHITSRLIVISTQRENPSDASSRQTAESIRNFLDTKYPQSYMIYSLEQFPIDQLSYQQDLFHNRFHNLSLFDEKQSPRLIVLLWFCQKITSYLLESPSNIAVLHSHDAKNQLAFGACSLLAYHQIFPRVDQIIQYYESNGCAYPSLTMSQKRYIQYLSDLSFGVIEKPHFNESILKSITLSPVPCVNRQKDGCRPFVDIYDQEHKKIFSTYQETAKLRVYSAADNCCSIPINLPFKDDITIHITHATIGNSRRTHEGGIRIGEFTINSNFSTLKHPELSYSRNELDGIDHNEKSVKYFRVTVDITNSQQTITNEQDSFSKQLDNTLKQPLALFKDENELKQKINDFEKQFKHQNSDINGKNEVPSSPDSSNASSRRSSLLFSGSFSPNPQSPSSFINPRHNPFKQQNNLSPHTSRSHSPLICEEKENKEQTVIDTLLDIGENYSNNRFIFERSISSDKQQNEFNSSIDSQQNLLDDDFDLLKSDLQRTESPTLVPTPIRASTIANTKQNASSSTKQSNTTSATSSSNYSVNMMTNNISSSQPQSIKPNSLPNRSQKPKIHNSHHFVDLDGFVKDPKQKIGPSTPLTIDESRKATLDKDTDPTVLKVREWTKGKRRNIRALLCSLSNVTWPECTWTGCQMSELVTHEQVKKVYRKAVLHIHPDKLRYDPNEQLAKLIFVELNEAWSQFQQESN